MPDGFTIKCNMCGKEITLEDNFSIHSDEREIYPDFDPIYESLSIQCKCGNKVDEF
jgi:DNA-directed RNA polymerase subunit RPC12/RpoP